MNRKITLEQESEIIKLIEIKSQKEISKMFGISQAGISKIMSRNNIKQPKKSRLNMSKLSLDVDYFNKIDDENKAYWLGYICGDGNINKNNNKVTIVTKDLEILERFKKDIKSGHTISNNIYLDKRTNKKYDSYYIQICNELFTKNLINIGITNNKTDELSFPIIDEKYYSYFIAGLFDSDGYIGVGVKKRVDIISTYEILKFMSDYLYDKFGVKELKFHKVSDNKDNVYRLYIYKDSKKFLDFIYGDNNFNYMSRKYKIYIDMYN